MVKNILYLDDYIPGVKVYTPEMEERKPAVRMEARLGHYGKHYYIDTTEELKGRGIKFRQTYTVQDFNTSGNYKIGWHSYEVTSRAFEILKEKYPIGYEILLD